MELQSLLSGPAGVLLSCCDPLMLQIPGCGYEVCCSTRSSVSLTVISFDSVKLKLIL